MTRYSRSVIPGRTADDSLDRKLFGERRASAANDVEAARDPGPDFRLLPDEEGGYRPPHENRRAPLILLGAFLTVAVFGAVVFSAYREGVRPADAEVAPEIASVGAFKNKPAETFARPSTETAQPSVFDAMESGAAPAAIAPAAAEVRPPAPAETNTTETVANPTQAITNPTPTPQQLASPPPLNTPGAPEPPALAGSYSPAFTVGGAWLVQVAAAPSDAAAQSEWSRRAASWPELFQGAERVIVRADVNGKTVYRVRAGAFGTQADADAFCAAIKGRGGDCFRATR